MKDIQTLADLPDVKGFRVLLRTGLNVPIIDNEVVSAFRLEKAIETILYLQKKGAIVLVVGHLGRKPDETLEPVYRAMQADLPDLIWMDTLDSQDTKAFIKARKPGDVILFENLRSYAGEIKNDEKFVERLAGLADLYVNDAFSDSHRAHASIVGVPAWLPGYMGLQFEREVANLSKALNPPARSLFILGGAKFDTKEPVLRTMLPLYDSTFVGGALANDFFKAMGLEVGNSLLSGKPSSVTDLLDQESIYLPADVTVENRRGVFEVGPRGVEKGDVIVDCGTQTELILEGMVEEASLVVWNGPLGNYEKGYFKYTEKLAQAIAASGVPSIVGGGDTIASIEKLGLMDKFTFVSTGGGAMLDYLVDGSLPGIEALKKSPRVASQRAE